jgi:hypothetical protein
VSVATLVTSLLGNPFRTTLYFGHMLHKSNGERAEYSVPRGAAVMLIRMTGLVPTVLHWLPLAVVATVIVWSGLVMVGQAFQEVSKEQCVAVLAAWAAALEWFRLRTFGARSGDKLGFWVAPTFWISYATGGLFLVVSHF